MTKLAILLCTVPCILGAALGKAARAQSVTVTFSDDLSQADPDDQDINEEFEVHITYFVPSGANSGVTIELPFESYLSKPVITYLNETHPPAGAGTPSWTHASATDTGTGVETHTWTATPTTGSAFSGTITLYARFESATAHGITLDETPFTFAATLSGTNNGSAFSVSGSGLRVAQGAPIVGWYSMLQGRGQYYDTIAGQPVVVERFLLLASIAGNAGLESYDWTAHTGGIPFKVKLGDRAHYVRSWAAYNSGGSSWPGSNVVSTASTPTVSVIAEPTVMSTGGTLEGRFDAVPTPTLGGTGFTHSLWIDVAYPCDEQGALVAGHAADYKLELLGGADTPVGLQPQYGGTTVAFAFPTGLSTYVPTGQECGTGGSFTKYHPGTTAPGNVVSWDAYLYFPYGVDHVDDFMIIDRVPDGSGDTVVASTNVETGLEIYFCELPLEPGYFSIADFIAYKSGPTPACERGSPDPRYSPPGMHVTHVVLYDDAEDASGPPYSVIGNDLADGLVYGFGVNISTIVDDPYTAGPQYENIIQAQGEWSFDGATHTLGNDVVEDDLTGSPASDPDPWEDHEHRDVLDYSCSGIFAWGNEQSPLPRRISPGECSYVSFRALTDSSKLLAQDPRYSIDVPAGVTVVDATVAPWADGNVPLDGVSWSGNGCTGMTAAQSRAHVTLPGAGDDPMLWQLGNGGAADPCKVDDFYAFRMELEFCVDLAPAGGGHWLDGQTLDFVGAFVDSLTEGTHGPGGQCPDAPDANVTFELDVEGEMANLISPSCQPITGAPSFVVEGTNTGGKTLTDVELRFRIPRAPASQADATFAGTDSIVSGGASAVVEVSDSDPAGTWVAAGSIPDANVRWVRLRGDPTGLTLAPFSTPLSFRVLLATSGADGDELNPFGEMIADEITLPAASDNPPPFIIGTCSELTIRKFHDADGSGTRGAHEPWFEGWGFTVNAVVPGGATGGTVGSGTTDASGSFVIVLPSGDYRVTEDVPGGNPSWHATTSGGASQDVTLTGEPHVTTFGNACTCADTDGDLCTYAPCNVPAATATATAGSELVVPLSGVTCGPDGSATCDDGSQCTDDLCDPLTGACQNDEPACEPVDYFAPVNDADGDLAGFIHCQLMPGLAPVCDTDAGGNLVIHTQVTNPTNEMCGQVPSNNHPGIP